MSFDRRRTLANSGILILLYAAPIWAEALPVAKYREILTKVQRKLLRRTVSPHSTVTAEALQDTADVMRLHLMVEERSEIYKRQTRKAKN